LAYWSYIGKKHNFDHQISYHELIDSKADSDLSRCNGG